MMPKNNKTKVKRTGEKDLTDIQNLNKDTSCNLPKDTSSFKVTDEDILTNRNPDKNEKTEENERTDGSLRK